MVKSFPLRNVEMCYLLFQFNQTCELFQWNIANVVEKKIMVKFDQNSDFSIKYVTQFAYKQNDTSE